MTVNKIETHLPANNTKLLNTWFGTFIGCLTTESVFHMELDSEWPGGVQNLFKSCVLSWGNPTGVCVSPRNTHFRDCCEKTRKCPQSVFWLLGAKFWPLFYQNCSYGLLQIIQMFSKQMMLICKLQYCSKCFGKHKHMTVACALENKFIWFGYVPAISSRLGASHRVSLFQKTHTFLDWGGGHALLKEIYVFVFLPTLELFQTNFPRQDLRPSIDFRVEDTSP